jgi:sporulation protein YlmC with PRC-barrel domain
MPGSNRTLRAHDLIGQHVRDRAGNHLGRIVDLVLDSTAADSGTPESRTPESRTPESRTTESRTTESGTPDSGAVEPEVRVPARVVQVVVTDGPWGRLLGYESPDDKGPWILSALARRIIHRHVRTLPWHDIVLDTGADTDA